MFIECQEGLQETISFPAGTDGPFVRDIGHKPKLQLRNGF